MALNLRQLTWHYLPLLSSQHGPNMFVHRLQICRWTPQPCPEATMSRNLHKFPTFPTNRGKNTPQKRIFQCWSDPSRPSRWSSRAEVDFQDITLMDTLSCPRPSASSFLLKDVGLSSWLALGKPWALPYLSLGTFLYVCSCLPVSRPFVS